MNKVNLGANYTHRITLRLNDEQYNFLLKVATLLGVSPSDYVRMSINTGMIGMGNSLDQFTSGTYVADQLEKGIEVGTTNENVKTDSNDIV